MLNRADKIAYLKGYISLADFISQVSGPNCEVVLRDYHQGESRILHIVHGEISGRKVGDTISGLMLRKIMREDYTNKDFVSNYLLVNELDQKLLRASTYYIKKDGELAGLLCVNYDLTELMRYRDFVNDKLLYGLNDNMAVESSEELTDRKLDVVVEKMIERVFLYWDRDIPLTRVDLASNPIRQLYELGVFNHKGSVNRVSEMLNMSVQSIYRYIKNIEESLDETC